MIKPSPISGEFELETIHSIISEGKPINLPNPKDLTKSELSDQVLNIWKHPEKYRMVSVTESSEFLYLMEEEGCICRLCSFTPEKNPYMVELKKRLSY